MSSIRPRAQITTPDYRWRQFVAILLSQVGILEELLRMCLIGERRHANQADHFMGMILYLLDAEELPWGSILTSIIAISRRISRYHWVRMPHQHSQVVIPTVDISTFLANPSSKEAELVASEIRNACMAVRFFQIVGHGIPPDLQDVVFSWSLISVILVIS